MLVNSLYWSDSGPCGVSIFNRHLQQAISPFGIDLCELNLRRAQSTAYAQAYLVHYVPSAFTDSEASHALMRLLTSLQTDQKLLVILHGLHGRGESRFLKDTRCPDQEHHVRLMLDRAESIIALSDSALRACSTWQLLSCEKARLLRLDHPGLIVPMENTDIRESYALIGGISRSKKDHSAVGIGALVDLCEDRGIRVWQHWTNVPLSQSVTRAWRQTTGPLTDHEWSYMVSQALVVLCPYETRIQSVSGIISEAVSAQRFVLATSFDLALEMQRRLPDLVAVENDLDRWPNIVKKLPVSHRHINTGVPTWDSFAKRIALQLISGGLGLNRPQPQELSTLL